MQRSLAIFFLAIFLTPFLVTVFPCLKRPPHLVTELADFMSESDEESEEKESKDSKEDSDKFFPDDEYTSAQLLNALSSHTMLLQTYYNYTRKIPVPPPQSMQS